MVLCCPQKKHCALGNGEDDRNSHAAILGPLPLQLLYDNQRARTLTMMVMVMEHNNEDVHILARGSFRLQSC